jgi:5-methylcytosine-specific restriction endonuclease McrA
MGRVRQTRAEYLRGYNKAGRQQRRAKLIEMLGGCCARCRATQDLEFDHIDPATKRFAVGSSMSRAWDELVEEALKCQLLCRSCHREKAVEDRPEPAHSYYPTGTTAADVPCVGRRMPLRAPDCGSSVYG